MEERELLGFHYDLLKIKNLKISNDYFSFELKSIKKCEIDLEFKTIEIQDQLNYKFHVMNLEYIKKYPSGYYILVTKDSNVFKIEAV